MCENASLLSREHKNANLERDPKIQPTHRVIWSICVPATKFTPYASATFLTAAVTCAHAAKKAEKRKRRKKLERTFTLPPPINVPLLAFTCHLRCYIHPIQEVYLIKEQCKSTPAQICCKNTRNFNQPSKRTAEKKRKSKSLLGKIPNVHQ